MNTLADKLPNALNLSRDSLTKINQGLPPILTIVILITCSYILSQITWALIPGDEELLAPPSQQKAQNKQAIKNYRGIADAHLFGNFQQTAVQVTQTEEAPETRLNLVLKGVLATTPMDYGNAIISMGKNGKEDTYGIGDKVSSATIKEIYADRVLLERGGKLETLRMPKDKNNNFIKTSSRSSAAARPTTPGGVLSNIRKEIIRNPTSFGKYAIPVPYRENGKLRGYRLQPQGDRSLFDTVGLQANDVIIAVNGIELKDPAKGLKALRALQRAKSIDLTILRNGSELPLHFDVP